jgi:hypothetical protein
MKSTSSRLPLFVGIGWLATAAIAFCIGRIGTAPAPVATGDEAGRPAAGKSGGTAAGSAAEFSRTPGAERAQFAMGEGDGSMTVARLTNGQPLDKWVKNLMAQQDGIVRMNGLLRLLEAVRDPEDMKTALGAFSLRGDRGFGRGARFTEYSMILEKWTQLDAKGAAAFVNSKGREEKWIGMSAVENVVRTWVKQDAPAAKEWIAQSALTDEVKARIQSPSRGGFTGRGRGPGN